MGCEKLKGITENKVDTEKIKRWPLSSCQFLLSIISPAKWTLCPPFHWIVALFFIAYVSKKKGIKRKNFWPGTVQDSSMVDHLTKTVYDFAAQPLFSLQPGYYCKRNWNTISCSNYFVSVFPPTSVYLRIHFSCYFWQWWHNCIWAYVWNWLRVSFNVWWPFFVWINENTLIKNRTWLVELV